MKKEFFSKLWYMSVGSWVFLMVLLPTALVSAQSLTIDSCQSRAFANYPLVKQYGIIEIARKYTIDNINKGYFPQLTLGVKASYQSDVTQIPSSLGNAISQLTHQPFTFPSLSKDQYQAMLDANQLLWDGGVLSAQKKLANQHAEVEHEKLTVDLYGFRDQVDRLFFGTLLFNEQVKQTQILINDLQTNYDKLVAYKDNGLLHQADLDVLRVEQLNAEQHKADLINSRNTFLILLSAVTGMKIDENTQLVKPAIDLKQLADTTNHRPELSLFDAQNRMYQREIGLQIAGTMPRLSLFGQAGYGKPGLNMFTNAFSDFYIGGVKLAWNISSLYSLKNNIIQLELNKKSVDIQKETFLFNNNIVSKQQRNEILNLQQSILNDDEIIGLRHNIKTATEAKVQNGAANVNDLIRDVNAENQARQTKSLHEIQLLTDLYQLKNTINN